MPNAITKAAAIIQPAEDDAEHPNGAFDVILSAESLDRDGDTLKRDEWKLPLPDHIVFDIDHGMNVASTVGSGKPFINDDGNLQVTGTYSSIPRAQEVRTLVNEGHIRTTSVAFLTEKSTQKDAKPVRELLNGAFVAIPSNRDAVVLSSKSVLTKDAATPDEDDHRHRLIQATDAALDEALNLFQAVDATSLPPEVQQAIALVLAADKSIDALQIEMGITDPDDLPGYTGEAAKSVATAATLKRGARNSADDRKSIQAVHDHAAKLGAVCPAGAEDSSGAEEGTEGGKALSTPQVTRKDADTDSDDDPSALIAATDAAIDQAIALIASVDPESLSSEVAQAFALIQGADATVDKAMVILGIPDPDDDTTDDSDSEPADEAASDSDESAAVIARALSLAIECEALSY